MRERGKRKTRRGVVVSDKMDKTITVKVERQLVHPLYKKYVKKSKKFYAHDELNEAHVGDVVEIAETKPISKNKCWRLLSVISHSVESAVEENAL